MTSLTNIVSNQKELKNYSYTYKAISKKEILKKFLEMLKTGADKFIADNELELSNNEKAILMHIHHTYTGSFSSISLYVYNLANFFNYTKKDFHQITSFHIKNFIEKQRNENKTPATINNKLAVLKSFYSYLHKTGIVTQNPTATIKRLRTKGKHEEKVLQIKEVQKTLSYSKAESDIRDYLIFSFLYATGVRVAEVSNLKWRDLFQDIKGRWQSRITGKGNKERTVFIPNSLYENLMIFKEYQFGVNKDDKSSIIENMPIFSSKKNLSKKLTTYSIYRIIRNLGENALGKDKRISPHWLRHSFATHARLNKATLESIMQALGHESYDTVLKYEHSVHITEPAGMVLEDNYHLRRKTPSFR